MPRGLNRSGDFRKGTPINTATHNFGNVVNWQTVPPAPGHFGNAEIVAPDPANFGNDVDWTPAPAHFGNSIT